MNRRLTLALLPGLAWSAETDVLPADEVAFFEKHIRPVLVEHCYSCHSAEAEKVKGGLTLDTRQGVLLGGESGHPGVTPGRPDQSSLYEAVTWGNPDMRMPPKDKLPAEVIDHLKKWIEMGAPDPREQVVPNPAGGRRVIDMAEGRRHWALRQPVKPALPEVKTEGWAKTDIDRFILAGLEAQGLKPVADADRRTLIRRIAFDLTGLPPTPGEVSAFLADRSSQALERVIDQYLDSPRFGERWARHWLDVARYAESSGKETNLLYPHAWRYRDYVIASFNRDKPYDQFLKEQIAGDLLAFTDKRDQAEKIIATGFLALGAKGHNNRDRRQFVMDLVDEQIDAVSQSMLGLTLACARCHDHKFDPVTQRDYYALAGIFLSSETLYGTYEQQQNRNPSSLIELDPQAGQPAGVGALSAAEVDELRGRLREADESANARQRELFAQRDSGNAAASFQRVRLARDRTTAIRADLDLFHEDGTPRALAMGVLDRTQPVDAPLLVRGDIRQPADVIPRGLVEVLCPEGEPLNIARGSGRLDLAYWIASPDNPLTARVFVNRVWLKLMGQGIVPTPDNFGFMGQAPTHPELLDHLAIQFMTDGWSVKQLIRSILLSRVYQLGSGHDPANQAVDPDNTWRWRMTQRRLEAEAIRDAMLAVSGELDLRPVAGSPVARAGEGREGLLQLAREMAGRSFNHRSIYLPIIRDQIPEFLNLFDFPDASLISGERDSTNVPGQSLFLMNSPQVLALADAFARRLAAFEGEGPQRLGHAYELAFARPPSASEAEAMRRFWQEFPRQFADGRSTAQAREQAFKAALSAFCQSLFASAEFRYLN
jgi:cytochrome c553